MKKRNGFVSNSSSSSFIVAVAKIVNEQKFNEWFNSLNIQTYECRVCNLTDIASDRCTSVVLKGDDIVVESFQTNAILKVNNITEKDKIFVVNITNDEGDYGRFSGDDEYGEYQGYIDYDIDIDYFSSEQRKLWDGLDENNGLNYIEKKFGAGRDG